MRIRKLPDDVVRRIAAGEVLLRPVNAVKELIENSVDAHATTITVTLTEGGMRGLSVSDDGDGIDKDDLWLLCERHATSKLHAMEDLQRLGTFGFRGEALASMSVAGRLTCMTRQADSPVGYRATFVDGRMVGESAQPMAVNKGTTIMVDDLFYSFPERRKLFLSRSQDEYGRVFEMMCKYAVCFAGRVGLTLKRGDKTTTTTTTLQTTMTMTVDDVIRAIHGNDLADNVITVDCEMTLPCDDDTTVGCDDRRVVTMKMFHSTPYYRRKEPIVNIFINDRLVEWSGLLRSVKHTYSQLILSGWHPWITIVLTVPADRLDANVSPTKHTVMLADNDALIEWIRTELEASLRAAGRQKRLNMSSVSVSSSVISGTTGATSSSSSQTTIIAPYKRIYSDHRDTKIDHFFSSPRSADSSTLVITSPLVESGGRGSIGEPKNKRPYTDNVMSDEVIVERKSVKGVHVNPFTTASNSNSSGELSVEPWNRPSVRLLKDRLQNDGKYIKSEEVSRVIKKHVMVGVGWRGEKTFIQYESCLMVVNTIPVARHWFYTRCIADLGRHGQARLVKPVGIEEAILAAIKDGHVILDESVDTIKCVQECSQLLLEKRHFFADYFGIVFEDDVDDVDDDDIHGGRLVSLPVLINDPAIPRRDWLGVLMFRLAVEVRWGDGQDEEEADILSDICMEIASVYSRLPFDDGENGNNNNNTDYVKNRLFPAMKTAAPFGFPTDFARQGHIQLVTELHTLYKQFDRC